MADVILHLGLHKTATGTLQRQFFPACDDLKLFTTRMPEMKAFVQMATKKDPVFFQANKARDLILPLLSEHRPNLLSNESFSGPPYSGVIEAGLDHRSPILSNLSQSFPNARAILVLRRQDELARSFYRQYLKSGGTRSIHRFYGMAQNGRMPLMSLDRFYFSSYVNAVKTTFPSGVLILAYEEFSQDQVSFLRKLAEFLGIQLPKINLRRENSTKLGPVGMELSRIFNHLFRSLLNPAGLIPGIPMVKYDIQTKVSPVQIIHDRWPGRRKLSSSGKIADIARQILEMAQEDNRILDRTYKLDLEKFGYY